MDTEKQTERKPTTGRGSLYRLVRMPAWTASKVEEIIAVAWLVAGLEAWHAGIRWLAWILFVKATLDVICAIGVALIEISEESAQHPNGGAMPPPAQ